MKKFILDCSITMAWCFEDESNDIADQILSYLTDRDNLYQAFVPSLWSLEVANVLYIAEKRSRITTAESLYFIELLANLPIERDITPYNIKDILTISNSYDVSAYDASYLLLALRLDVPLATLDKKLRQAAGQAHISLLL